MRWASAVVLAALLAVAPGVGGCASEGASRGGPSAESAGDDASITGTGAACGGDDRDLTPDPAATAAAIHVDPLVSRTELMKMMLAVQSAGFTTLSTRDYVRAMQGDLSGLPPRPLLVTFDDGRLDSYRGTDDVLRVTGSTATMFVLTGELDKHPAYRMTSAEVQAALASGRWDIQLHAHRGHVDIDAGVDDFGAPVRLPFYAAREQHAGASAGAPAMLESFAAWKLRAESDILTGQALLAARSAGPSYAALTFAVPFGNYGQLRSNDPAIAQELRTFLDAHFAVWFTQPTRDPDFTLAPAPTGSHEAQRFTVYRSMTAETVYDWLARHASEP